MLLCIFFAPSKIMVQSMMPKSTTGVIIFNTYITISYYPEHKQAEWVYYVLTPEFILGSQSRTNNFSPDPKIPNYSAQLHDYKNSGYDRGHLCPAADMKLNYISMSETFLLSNISPQNPSFNRGIWSRLELVIRAWGASEGIIYVITGPVLSNIEKHIGPSNVSVPSYFYKVIYDPTDEKKMIAFVLPNQSSSRSLINYVVSVDSVETLTGIDFFHELADSVQNRLETFSDISKWDFSPFSINTVVNYSRQCALCCNITVNVNSLCIYHSD